MDNMINGYLSFSADNDYLANLYLVVGNIQLDQLMHQIETLDIEEGSQSIRIDYVLSSSSWSSWISYRDETGKEVGRRPDLRLPWTYTFEAQLGDILSVSLEDRGACAILVDGRMVDFNIGNQAAICNASMD